MLRVETCCFRSSVQNGRQRKGAAGVGAVETADSTIVEVPLLIVGGELNERLINLIKRLIHGTCLERNNAERHSCPDHD